jgi:hypothetical protein
MKYKKTVVAVAVSVAMAVASGSASAREFTFASAMAEPAGQGMILGALGVAVGATVPGLVVGGVSAYRYFSEENVSHPERANSKFKQCYARSSNTSSDMANSNAGKINYDTTIPTADELPSTPSKFNNQQRFNSIQASLAMQCSSQHDVVGGYVEGGTNGENTAYFYCTNQRGITAPHMAWDLEILKNGKMVRRTGSCVTVMDDEESTAKYVRESGPNKLD